MEGLFNLSLVNVKLIFAHIKLLSKYTLLFTVKGWETQLHLSVLNNLRISNNAQ